MAKDPVQVERATDEVEIRTVADLLSKSLFFSLADVNHWIEVEGRENFRAARRNGQVIGGFTVQRMGQWFGGRCVPIGAIRAVGVAPEHRSAGVGAEMMRAAIRELHRDGVPLAVLFPATQPVYRRAGFEVAGVRMGYRIATRDLDVRDCGLTIRPGVAGDHAVIRELYTSVARVTPGNLDRNEWMWRRTLEPPPWLPPVSISVVERDGRCEGYVVVSQKTGSPQENRLAIADFATNSSDALRRLLSFVADHRSVAPEVRWFGGPCSASQLALAEQRFVHFERMDWMLRVVDVVAAFEQRGFPQGLTGQVHLEVRDDVVDANNRRFQVEVSNGRAVVSEGGRGGLQVSIRGLAALFTGMFSPYELRNAGLLIGSEESLAAASQVFSGPTPWMADSF